MPRSFKWALNCMFFQPKICYVFLIIGSAICQCNRELPLTYKFAIICLIFPQLQECPAILWERLNTVW